MIGDDLISLIINIREGIDIPVCPQFRFNLQSYDDREVPDMNWGDKLEKKYN